MASKAELWREFPYIVLWGKHLQSFDYYITEQCLEAKSDGAPHNAFQKRDGRWITTDEITVPEVILAWQLSCTNCGGTHAKPLGCNDFRHDVYDGFRSRTGKFADEVYS